MSDFWNALFSPTGANRYEIELRQLSKHGRPFLLLPRRSGAAATTLELYPAQSARAKIAKSLLRAVIKAGLPFGLERTILSVSSEDDFLRFLKIQAGNSDTIPQFGILAGNPAHETQRFIFALFGANQDPVAVVKAGLSEPAKALIEKERQFLSRIPEGTLGIPKLRAPFDGSKIKAFAMEYVEGKSPQSSDRQQLGPLFCSWLKLNAQIPLCQAMAWQQLERAGGFYRTHPLLRGFRERKIQSTLQHGDFVPWNIRLLPDGRWLVLDWERGDLNGIPGWDWFHYLIQPAILLEHKPADEIAEMLRNLIDSEAFKAYSNQAGIAGIERELLVAYLAHMVEVINPAEGLESNGALLKLLSSRWFQIQST